MITCHYITPFLHLFIIPYFQGRLFTLRPTLNTESRADSEAYAPQRFQQFTEKSLTFVKL
jgi:hypothetical protein